MICPGFSADCLETIEEIGEENREYFMENGGERYEYIPSLNSDDAHLDMLFGLLESHMQGWQSELNAEDFELRGKRAEQMGPTNDSKKVTRA